MSRIVPVISELTEDSRQRSIADLSINDGAEPAVLVHIHFNRQRDEESLAELDLLARSAGALPVARVTGSRRSPDPALFVGKGKAEEIRRILKDSGAELVLINHIISPVQERNLERALECRVIDRTGLILDIFATRAESHEGKLQVELAQLRYLSTRLIRGWTHLERQKGGIGLRGPGETQLETDRRLLGQRIKSLRTRLEKVRKRRSQRRKARKKIPVSTVSLVGYTNAGKSSIFNYLTGAGVYQADQLFATLDPTMRRLDLPNAGHIILADTVGFISHLPHTLVKAFHSTLEEVSDAALLLHVVDRSSDRRSENIEQVNEVLKEIDAADIPVIMIFNKVDLVDREAGLERNKDGVITKVWLSASTGEGMEYLQQAVDEHFSRLRFRQTITVPVAEGALRAKIFQRFSVLHQSMHENGDWEMEIEGSQADMAWLHRETTD
ncbi:MAG TPA: GTPase HflX [Gammaproteobacteria bacterium]|nr:GTPase HflX [bacterium BMS3Abin11]HDH08276.1 GTPase HflX [Gammaproteobacteria bacterium]HDH16440.1 GTPase HflX [Gammaproteobacteria bacterium]HDZ78570.1 GTPase HflX [Gammaproteobacteria bacterium]